MPYITHYRVYNGDNNIEHITIEKADNGRYFVNYGVRDDGSANCFAGPFPTHTRAFYTLKKHRPTVEAVGAYWDGGRS